MAWLSRPTYRQLSAGRFSGVLERVRFGGIEVGHEQHGQDVQKFGAMPPGQCTLSFIDSYKSNARFSQFAQDETSSNSPSPTSSFISASPGNRHLSQETEQPLSSRGGALQLRCSPQHRETRAPAPRAASVSTAVGR